MNIVLTGFMASGKTTVGTVLAELLRYRFIDTDKAIEEKQKMTVNDIFKNYGEEYFRKLETEILCELSDNDNCVISVGGGAVLRSENMDILRKNGKIVNIAPDFEIIAERIEEASKTRPLMKGKSIEEIKKLFYFRLPYYDNCDIKLKITDKMTAEECSKKIIELIGNEGLKYRKD